MLRKLLYPILLGLTGAGIVHIAVLFLVPTYSEGDAWSQVAAAGQPFQIVPISGTTAFGKEANPFMRTIACHFEIDPGIARIRAEGEVPFWSAAIFDRKGRNVYSLNDRTTVGGRLDLVVATPVQMVELRKDLPAEMAESVFVELDSNQGLAVIRVAVPDRSWSALADSFLKGARCLRT